MGSQRAHVVLPQDLLEEIDAMVGARGRSAFLVEIARQELRKRRLLEFLQSDEGIDEAAHPEWIDAAAWVQALRRESDKRIPHLTESESAAD